MTDRDPQTTVTVGAGPAGATAEQASMRVRHRSVLALVSIFAVFTAACSTDTGEVADAQPTAGQEAAAAMPPADSQDPVALHDAMRKLWVEHVAWTRLYIVSAVAGLPDVEATAERLLQNQVDIGNAVKPYYGEEAGAKLIGTGTVTRSPRFWRG